MEQGGYCFLCLKEDHKIRGCKWKKDCFYCKGLHNFAICSERDKKDDKNKADAPSKTTNNSATCQVEKQLTPAVILHTAAVYLGNLDTKHLVKVKVLLDAGLQRTYISERIWKFVNLSIKDVEDVSTSISENCQTQPKYIDCVLLLAKTNYHENILMKVLCLPMLRLPISSPSITFLKRQFEKIRGTEFVDEDSEKDIDLLIGSVLYCSFVTGNIVKSRKSGSLAAVETKFGWIKWVCWCEW